MALLTLITGNIIRRTRFMVSPKGPDLMVVDAVLSQTAEYEAEPTENPVEEGVDVTDHVKLKPVRFSMEGIASETPMTLAASLQGLSTTVASVAGTVTKLPFGSALAGAAAGGFGAALQAVSKSPADEMREFLIQLVQARKTFTLWTPQRRYDDMIMTNISFPRDQATGRALRFSAQLKQIRIVKSETVRLDNVSEAVLHSAAEKSGLGRQAASNANAQKARQSSILYGLLNSAGVIK